jgi:nucleotide-binding universal stress UspA family protein
LKDLVEDARRRLEHMLEETASSIGSGVEVQRFVLEGAPVKTLAGAAENGVDLLVAGSRQYGPVRRVLLGSVSSGLVRSSPTSVLVVPRGGGDEDGKRTTNRTED